MAPGLSEYELQRQKNLEENRRILESIRQEQAYAFEPIKPVKKKKEKKEKKVTNDDESEAKPRKKIRKVETDVKEIEEEESQSDSENAGRRRKSARVRGKAPKYAMKDDPDFEYSVGEESDDDDDDYVRKKKSRPLVKGPRPKIIIPKDRPNFYGAVPGVPVGRLWETRMACCADGIHRPTVAGIHGGPEGAYSISLAGGYEDDVDLGDCFTYTGEGGRALKGTKANPKNLRTAPQSKDQTLTRGNLALSLNITSRKPIRVIRGAKMNNEFAPEYGYRYDGLYTVEKYWSCVGKSGFKVFKFALRRCPNQVPPPWVSGLTYTENVGAASSTEDDDIDPDEEPESKPSVLTVKLFNK